jgi:cyclopropane-fatty-acyl-phospholipid synthase
MASRGELEHRHGDLPAGESARRVSRQGHAARPARGSDEVLAPVVERLFPGGLPIGIRLWDGATLGPQRAAASVVMFSPNAIRRLVWSPSEVGLGRAYVAGELDVDGDLFAALSAWAHRGGGSTPFRLDRGAWRQMVRAARELRLLQGLGSAWGALPEERRLHGRRHSRRRDAAAIAHHYDVSNDFYRLVLGPTLTYSCAYFARPGMTLDEAQTAKYDLICRKLGLGVDSRLLDVGCGWGGMVIHAARYYGARAVGITISPEQAELAERRVLQYGLTDRVEIRLQDYRDLDDPPYDAISSIGMFEHVGAARLAQYFGALFDLLAPAGRLLNHGISRPAGRRRGSRRSFMDRYVFPDGELHEIGTVVTTIQERGFEVRDVESLREHYARTLRAWVANLEAHQEQAEALAGPARARIWRLYMAVAGLGFDRGTLNLHQVLAVRPGPGGTSRMPATRLPWLGN